VRYLKSFAVIVILHLCSSYAPAAGLPVIVELVDAPAAKDGSASTAFITGDLLEPANLNIVGKAKLNLKMVLSLTFVHEDYDVQYAVIKDLNNQISEKGIKQADKDALQVRIDAETTKLNDIAKKTPSQVRAITKYDPISYDGVLDLKVNFLIGKQKASNASGESPPVDYSPNKLKGIYFLPPTTPQAAPPETKAKTAIDRIDDQWLTVSNAVGKLQQERKFLLEQLSNLACRDDNLDNMLALEPSSDLQSTWMNKQVSLIKVREKIIASIGKKDLLIEGYQIELAFLSPPRAQLLPEANGVSPKALSHSLYVMDGAHYGQINDFGDGPYLSSSCYAKVLPGMKLTVQNDGYWKLEYRMLTMARPVRAYWELKIRYLDEFGSPREIPLQTFARHVNQIRDTDNTIQNVWHSGSHPAIQEFFGNISTTGCLLRIGQIQFQTDNPSGLDIAKEDDSNSN